MTCSNVTAPLEVLAMDYTQLEMCSGGYENVLVLTVMFTRGRPINLFCRLIGTDS